MDPDYDAALEEEASTKSELEQVLRDLKTGALKGSGVKWWHHKTKLEDQYQLEVPFIAYTIPSYLGTQLPSSLFLVHLKGGRGLAEEELFGSRGGEFYHQEPDHKGALP